jgi:hypothetical protein
MRVQQASRWPTRPQPIASELPGRQIWLFERFSVLISDEEIESRRCNRDVPWVRVYL